MSKTERLSWLFKGGMAGLDVYMQNGEVVIESYTGGGYGYEDVTEHHYLDAAQSKQLRDWLNENVKD